MLRGIRHVHDEGCGGVHCSFAVGRVCRGLSAVLLTAGKGPRHGELERRLRHLGGFGNRALLSVWCWSTCSDRRTSRLLAYRAARCEKAPAKRYEHLTGFELRLELRLCFAGFKASGPVLLWRRGLRLVLLSPRLQTGSKTEEAGSPRGNLSLYKSVHKYGEPR